MSEEAPRILLLHGVRPEHPVSPNSIACQMVQIRMKFWHPPTTPIARLVNQDGLVRRALWSMRCRALGCEVSAVVSIRRGGESENR